jgi:uncharacterized protein (TIGR02001 family)
MKNSSLVFVLTGLLTSHAVFAQDSAHSFSANVAMTSDYVYRGISQSDEGPAIQGGFDYSHSTGWYLGAWGSSIEFFENRGGATFACSPNCKEGSAEVDLYGGYGGNFSDRLSYDAGLIYYAYPGAENSLDYDFIEGYAGLSYSLKDVMFEPSLGLKVSYSPDFFGTGTDDAVYVESSVDLSLPAGFAFGVHLGLQTIDNAGGAADTELWDWKVGVSKDLAGFNLDLSYYDTDVPSNTNDLADARIVFSVSRSF